MGDPRKRRKLYETPRRKWDKELLEYERKLVDFYGLKNKKELRRLEAWVKRKRKIAKDLMVLPVESREQRQKELMSGLMKYGLVRSDATLDDVLGLKVEAVLEKRLQTLVMRKGLANTSKQARQFIVHGHIAINGKRIDSPGYLVPVEEVSGIGWYRKPIKIVSDKVESKRDAKEVKKEFEESIGVVDEKKGGEGSNAEAGSVKASEGEE